MQIAVLAYTVGEICNFNTLAPLKKVYLKLQFSIMIERRKIKEYPKKVFKQYCEGVTISYIIGVLFTLYKI